MGIEDGPDQNVTQREEGLKKLRELIDQSKLSDEAKQVLQISIYNDPDFEPFIKAALHGGLLVFEDTDQNGDKRAVIVDENQKIAHWQLFDYPDSDTAKFVGTTGESYDARRTSGSLTEREVLEVRKSYAEDDPDVKFDENGYNQKRLDKLNQEAEEEGKGLHEN